MSDIVSWWSACCAFTVMLLLGTVLLGRFLSAIRIVLKATCSSAPAKAIGELTYRGKDPGEISSRLKRAVDIASQVKMKRRRYSVLEKPITRNFGLGCGGIRPYLK